MALITGLLTAAVAGGTLGYSIWESGEAADDARGAEKRARRMAMLARDDAMKAQRFEQGIAQEQMQMRWQQFNFGKRQFGMQYALELEKWKEQKKLARQQMHRQGFDRLTGNITNAMQRDMGSRQNILSRARGGR